MRPLHRITRRGTILLGCARPRYQEDLFPLVRIAAGAYWLIACSFSLGVYIATVDGNVLTGDKIALAAS